MSDKNHFNATRILILLAVLTAVEVAWAVVPLGLSTLMLRLGLIVMALWKGYLIFMFFMHMKFEGWIVKGLLVPTVPLMMIVVFANMPDTSYNDHLVYPAGSMATPDGAQVLELRDVAGHGHEGGEDHGDSGGH